MGSRPTKTGGRPASGGVIPGNYALSVGLPDTVAPSGWRWTQLTDVARLESGHTPSRKHSEYWGGDIPWIGIADATENHGRVIFDTHEHTNNLGIANSSARVLPPNTVCLSRTASVGYVVVMGTSMATSQDFVNWVCSDAIDHRYLKYVLLAEREAFRRFSSGTTHQTIYFPEVKAFHVCLPPIEEQRSISNVLGALDNKIALNSRIVRTAGSLIRAMFNQLIASRTMTIGGIYALAHVEYGAPFASVQFNNAGLGRRLIRIRDLAHHEPELFTTEQHPRETIVSAGDVVVGMDGEFRAHYWRGDAALLNQRLCLFRPQQDVPRTYVGEVIREALMSFERSKTGTTVIHLGKADIDTFRVPIPTSEELEAYGNASEPILARALVAARESRTLGALRDALLTPLLMGRVRLSASARRSAA